MELTPKNKTHIDSLEYETLLHYWRFAPSGDPWFEGKTGEYWFSRMAELRKKPEGEQMHVAASKNIGWGDHPSRIWRQ